MLALAHGRAVVDIAFDVEDARNFVKVPVDGIHCEAEHEDGECPPHVNALPDDSWGEELPSHFYGAHACL